MTTFVIAVPQWFIDGVTGRHVRDAFSEYLERYGAIFVPFAASCAMVRGSGIECRYEELSERVTRLGRVLGDVGNTLRLVILHTDYYAAKWFDREFIDRYAKATTEALDIIARRSSARHVEVELHPGFSSDYGDVFWSPIIDGMATYISRVSSIAEEYGFELSVTLENRSSSQQRTSRGSYPYKPQAVSLFEELVLFSYGLEKKLQNMGIECDVGIVIDFARSNVALRKLYGYRREDLDKLAEIVLERLSLLIDLHGDRVRELHVHWYREFPKQGLRDHSPMDREVLEKLCKPVIEKLKPRHQGIVIVPEVLIRSRDTLRETLAMMKALEEITAHCRD